MNKHIALSQNGSYFKFEKTSLILQQYSSDIHVHIEYDGTYNDYIVSWRFSKNIENDKTYLLKYDSDTHVLTLPYTMLSDVSNNCSVYLQAKFVKGDTVVHSNVIKILIKRSLADTQIVSPDEPSDITLITDIVDQKFEIDIIPQVEQITADAKQYRDEAKTSADQAEITLNGVIETADREKVQIIETASNETKKACDAIESYKNDKKVELQASVDGWKSEISAQGNEIIQDANGILTDVRTISETVSENAEIVEASTQQAKTYRDDAGRYASNANLSAQQASSSAENALTSKTDAETAKNNAKASETTASQKASDASNSEKKAKEYWTNAQAEAFNASKSATSALESKNSAQINADAIRSSAEKIDQNSEAINQLRESSFNIALIKRTEGYTVSIDDSANYYPKSIGMFGETHQTSTTGTNYIDSRKYDNSIDNGVAFTKNVDGSVLAKGTATASNAIKYLGEYINDLEDGAKYISSTIVKIIESGAPKYVFSFTVNKATMTSIIPYIQVQKLTTVNETSYPMLNKGDKLLPWEACTGGTVSPNPSFPQEMVSKIVSEIKVTGANLLDFKTGKNVKNVTENSFNIVATSDIDRVCFFNPNFIVGETYCISFSRTADYAGAYIKYINGVFIYFGTKKVITIEKEVAEFSIYIDKSHIGETVTITNPMLNRGTTALQWEPYKEQVVTLSQPITLRGLPVTTGGNVTIDGQQYISDSIEMVDDEYKVIRRIGVIDNTKWTETNVAPGTAGKRYSYNDPDAGGYFLAIRCTHYLYRSGSFNNEGDYISSENIQGSTNIYRILIRTLDSQYNTVDDFKRWMIDNDVQTYYAKTSPLFTSLPPADQQAIKELQTYSHNTNITADGAWLSVEYVADQRINNDGLIKRLEALEGVVVNNV